MKNTTANYRDGLLKDLADPDEAAAYLNAAIEDGVQDVLRLAQHDIADAKGMSRRSRKMLDRSTANLKKGLASPAIDLTQFKTKPSAKTR